ncbi:MAG: histidine kinase N-terminal 7TM domain-containing protein [Methanomassiliicoccales archaeon]|jgi:signal transduction histidine kinase
MDEKALVLLVVMAVSVVAIVLASLSWSGSKRSFRVAFIGFMVSVVLIGWGYFLGISVDTIDERLLTNNIEYIGYIGAPLFFFIFSIRYTGSRIADRRNIVLLVALAVAFETIVVTNGYHHLYYDSVFFTDNSLVTFDADAGPLFYAFCTYTLVLIIGANVVLVGHFIKTRDSYRKGVGLVALMGFISLATVILYYTVLRTAPSGLVVMLGFFAGSIPLFIGAFQFNIFEMLPFANEKVIETMKGSVFVLDTDDHVLFINRSGETLSGRSLKDVYGDHISDVLPLFPADMLRIGASSEKRQPIPVLEVGGGFYETDVSAIRDQTESLIGKLVLIRDVTSRVLAERDAEKTRDMLEILNSFTRHDIRNQLVSLEGYINLVKMRNDDPELSRHLDAGMRSAMAIEKQIEFAKDYQDLGCQEPVWQSLRTVANSVEQSVDLSRVNCSVDTKGVEVLADPLLTKVFYCLADNSITHGERVANIVLKVADAGDHLDIVYEDDGVGVPVEMKSVIFDKGVGKHTGLGLYLAKEILRIGGMEIIEDGVYDEGARFRITVPSGRYRFPDD